jgi:hypothetical protein
MPIRKPKQFDVQGHTVTVDAGDFSRVQPFISHIRAVQMTAGNPATIVFLVNHGSANLPSWQTLPAFLLGISGVYGYVVLKDRTDPGDHTQKNLVRG